MPFQTSAETLRAKLHLSSLSTPALVGICMIAALACAMVALSVFDLFGDSGIDVMKKEGVATEAAAVTEADRPDSDDRARPKAIVVHVAGAVAVPGVYELEEGSRLLGAVEAAGGFTEQASPSSLNLARILNDGEQVLVPTAEEAEQAATQTGPSKGQPLQNGKVNINTADAAALSTLPGIGEVTAAKIVDDREANGPFSSIEDLQRVSGIGAKKYAELSARICVA